MKQKANKILSIVTLVCLAIGFIVGFFLRDFSLAIKFLGDWYVKLLKIIVGPVIFVSIFCSILKKNETKSFILIKTVGLFALMFITTFLLTSGIVAVFQPGKGFVLDDLVDSSSSADFSAISILRNLLPTSFLDFLLGKNLFLVILVALFLSFIISKTPIREKTLGIFDVVKKYLNYILQVIILLTPVGVLSLVSNMVVTYGSMIITVGLKYILFAWGISIVALILVMMLPVWIVAKINPIIYVKKVAKVWLVSLSTCSSLATLPHTIKVCNEEFGVKEEITDIVVPLGCTIHMCGGAVSFALLGFFVAQMSAYSISFGTFMLMILFATLINMAAPGIPGGGRVIGVSYLALLNLPISGFYGFYSGIYSLLDMSYTTLNVTGDVSANVLLDYFFRKKEEKSE